jgi:hypothetical protein
MGGLPPRNAGHASGARPSSTPFTGACCHAKAVSKRIVKVTVGIHELHLGKHQEPAPPPLLLQVPVAMQKQ